MAESDSFDCKSDHITLTWLTDNQNVEKFLAKGSGKVRIMKLVLDILRRCRKLLFDLQPIWVSRDNPFLLKADAISKGIDTNNWSILESDFEQLSILAGPFSVDLFATRKNAKCSKLYTRSWERGCSGVDSFAQSWAGECAFAAPPVSLVMRTIRKIAVTVMSGILVIPLWKKAKFWTFAFRDGAHLNEMMDHIQIVRMYTLAWEFATEKDVIGGKDIQFLVITSRCPYCAFSFNCKFRGMRSLKSCNSCQIM
jgi:hypothetical protein